MYTLRWTLNHHLQWIFSDINELADEEIKSYNEDYDADDETNTKKTTSSCPLHLFLIVLRNRKSWIPFSAWKGSKILEALWSRKT
ncbi:hypothetical protein NQ318_001566 [Aromia moschata]|uniref:Uncharacterized protein n=1 Tax=Aromia moschata TaxID=1265417 RepID=A0AAV8XA22_9CUCU|nr:hypothetical protein NQ318_001566 [Aromia moschata]